MGHIWTVHPPGCARGRGGGGGVGVFVVVGVSRNCVARLWWSRHAGENAETMAWEAFEEAFQSDVSCGCKGALVFCCWCCC